MESERTTQGAQQRRGNCPACLVMYASGTAFLAHVRILSVSPLRLNASHSQKGSGHRLISQVYTKDSFSLRGV